MHVVILGATGLIGKALCKKLYAEGYEVFAVSRNAVSAQQVLGETATALPWDDPDGDGWMAKVSGASSVINLAGENIGEGRWTVEKKKRILDSRLTAVRTVNHAIEKAGDPPKALIQASAIGYYGYFGGPVLDEITPVGAGFLADVCNQWEDASNPALDKGVRRVILRTGVVFSREGGALLRMVQPVRAFVGGTLGKGDQWMSWIHIEDLIRAIAFLIMRDDLSGAFNMTAPQPLTNKELTQRIAKQLRRPALLRVPTALLKLVFGSELAEEMLLGGRKVLPDALLKAGFTFKHGNIDGVLDQLLS